MLHHSVLPFIIHYYTSSCTTTLHHSLLPFIIHYYPSSLNTTLHHSLLPFIIQHYSSSFPTTLHHSLLPIIIHYYPSSFTTTLHHSLYTTLEPPLYMNDKFGNHIFSEKLIILQLWRGHPADSHPLHPILSRASTKVQCI